MERLVTNDLIYVEWDIKSLLTHSFTLCCTFSVSCSFVVFEAKVLTVLYTVGMCSAR